MKISQPFEDKITGERRSIGDEFTSTDVERIGALIARGFISSEPTEENKAEPVETKPDAKPEMDPRLEKVGGGYYLLPNGEKIRGIEKAIEALKLLDVEV